MNKLVEALRSEKKINITEINKWGQYLRGVWEDEFADSLSEEDKETIYLSCFSWHLFSYRKVRCHENEQAKTKFNNELKNSCYVFYQHSDFAIIIENAMLIQADDFDNEDDVYIMDKEYRWTYVKTHESDCGPYFYYNNNTKEE